MSSSKRLSFAASIALLLLLRAPVVSALEIEVTETGHVVFYEESVLGDDDESDEKSDDEGEDEDKDEENESEDEDENENEDEIERERTRLRTVTPTERRRIEVRDDETKVEVRLRDHRSTDDEDDAFERVELKSTGRMKLQVSADGLELEEEEESEELTELEKKRLEYRLKIQDERAERHEEKVEIQSELKEGRQEFQIEARGLKAKIKSGASFLIDPETNEIILTTPSGNEHILHHLPDQAVERMREAGLLSTELSPGQTTEIDLNEEGEVVYRLEKLEKKRLLGLFPRQVKKEVELDDQTGEVVEREVMPESLVQRWLARLSF